MSIEAMKQALDALCDFDYDKRQLAIAALRAAIEQAETPEKRREQVDPIRVRIMQEAYDLADRDDSEGYNSVKVMCSEVLGMIDRLLDERQWQGLTKKEFLAAVDGLEDLEDCWVAIEAKLKEKNG